jgi:hypothetical protein
MKKRGEEMIRKLKDSALSKGTKTAINTQIKEFGRMLKFDLDSHTKSISLEVMLEGEKEPLEVEVARYELEEEGGRYLLRLYGVKTSRAWINTLAVRYLEGKAFEIPAEYAKVLKVVI